MTPEQKQALQEHIQANAKILYEDTSPERAQWKRENVPQVLAHRCAYLNGLLLV